MMRLLRIGTFDCVSACKIVCVCASLYNLESVIDRVDSVFTWILLLFVGSRFSQECAFLQALSIFHTVFCISVCMSLWLWSHICTISWILNHESWMTGFAHSETTYSILMFLYLNIALIMFCSFVGIRSLL